MPYRKKSYKKRLLVSVAAILAFVAVIVVFWAVTAGREIPVLNPRGDIAAKEKDLLLFTLVLSIFVVVPVFTMLGVFAWKYRAGNTKSQYTPDVDGNKGLELLWWGIPIFIIGILSIVTWNTTHQLDPHKQLVSDVAPLKVQVVALQWKWLFLYPEQQVASLNQLKIPAGTPVNFELTADAPMSAFWIPSLGSQVYAMTGMSSKLSLIADKPGTYRGVNTSINGEGYADMTFDAIALENRSTFNQWTKAIEKYKDHTNLDLATYENLVKPSRNENPKYYHLHDPALYTKIVNKFAHDGKSETTKNTEPQMDNHKEGYH